MILVNVGHGKVVAKESRMKVDGRLSLVTDLTFKGNPQTLAKSMAKMHGRENALLIVKKLQSKEVFWQQVERALTKAV